MGKFKSIMYSSLIQLKQENEQIVAAESGYTPLSYWPILLENSINQIVTYQYVAYADKLFEK